MKEALITVNARVPEPNRLLDATGMRPKVNPFAARLAPIITALHRQGLSPKQITAELTARCILTPAGSVWTVTSVRRVLSRTEAT